MSHILFIRNETLIPSNIREVFSAPDQRIVVRQSPTEAQSALERGAFDAVVVYADSGEDTLRRNLSSIRAASGDVFIIVLTPNYSASDEAAAFEEGADLFFDDSVPPQTLKRLLEQKSVPSMTRELPVEAANRPLPPTAVDTASTLRTLRDLSHILSFSLDYKAFTHHFILKLRDHISFSRIGIFIESSAKQSIIKNSHSSHLECIASLGLPSDLIDCFQLSRETGIGKEISEHPRILHRQKRDDASYGSASASTEKEFAILGCDLAIPISDREGSIGIAVLSGPITGRRFTDDELELLYVLMVELGLAICNSRLHSELAQHGQLIENVLHSMSSGALVCGEDLQILYANDAAKRFLRIEGADTNRAINFAELPSDLAGPVHRAVEKGELPEPFKFEDKVSEDIYRVSIFPFTQKGELMLLPRPTMVIIEDFTKIEAVKQSAVDDSKSELISLIAERFAHEIRNSLVPLSAHAQMIDRKIEQPKFQTSLKSALQKETARIKRFSEQMLYMAQFSSEGGTTIQISRLIEQAFESAKSHLGNTEASLVLGRDDEEPTLSGNEEALTYALQEIFLNSIQSFEEEQSIEVSYDVNNEGIVQILIRDSGPGIPEKVVERAAEPFYTTRNTGVGLGLSVAQKIFSEHGGFLRLNTRTHPNSWDVIIELPSLITAS